MVCLVGLVWYSKGATSWRSSFCVGDVAAVSGSVIISQTCVLPRPKLGSFSSTYEVVCVVTWIWDWDCVPFGAALSANRDIEPWIPFEAPVRGSAAPSAVDQPRGLYPASRSIERGKNIYKTIRSTNRPRFWKLYQ